VSLSSVLSEVRVNEVDEIVSDWSGEDCWHSKVLGNLLIFVYGHNWS